MEHLHPLSPQLEVFAGQESTHSAAELQAAADIFRNISNDALLGHVDNLDYHTTRVYERLLEEGLEDDPKEYTTTGLDLTRKEDPASRLLLNDGRLEIKVGATDINDPAVPESVFPTVIRVTYYSAKNETGLGVVYRLGRDGVVRREDVATPNPLDEAEAASNMAAINRKGGNSDENWARETERQLRNSAVRKENRALEDAMNVNRRPVGFDDMYWLSDVLQYAEVQ